MFTTVSQETAWEWAKARRRWFTTPVRDTVTAIVAGIVAAFLFILSGAKDWFAATGIGVLAGIVAGLGLPWCEAAFWWCRRDSILLAEENDALRRSQSEQQQDAVQAVVPAPQMPHDESALRDDDDPAPAPIAKRIPEPPFRFRLQTRGAIEVIHDNTSQYFLPVLHDVRLFVEDLWQLFRGDNDTWAEVVDDPMGFPEIELEPHGGDNTLRPGRDLIFYVYGLSDDWQVLTLLGHTFTEAGQWRLTLRCEWRDSGGNAYVAPAYVELIWRPGEEAY